MINEENNIENDNSKEFIDYEEETISDDEDNLEFETAKSDFEFLAELPGDDEVLQLTEFDGNIGLQNANTFVSAEYKEIDIAQVDLKHKKVAQSFVNKITSFILDFKDVDLSDKHKLYIKEVANLELINLQDLLSLVTINRAMLDNIIRRVNAVQQEDYAMVAAYINMSNQHLKLIKDLSNTYRAIPAVLKKMRTEVLCDQDLIGAPEEEGLITIDHGTTQFNNTKELLKELRLKQEEKDGNTK